MPKKIRALDPRVREEECNHPAGFAYTGRVPNTGPQVCYLCGTRKEDQERADLALLREWAATRGVTVKLSSGQFPYLLEGENGAMYAGNIGQAVDIITRGLVGPKENVQDTDEHRREAAWRQ